MISLARTDGARKDLLELCTHNPRKNGSTIDIYTEFPWEALCGEVAKLKIARREPEPPPAEAPPAETTRAVPEVEAENAERAGEPGGSDPPFATRLATREAIPESFQSVTGWRRRESNGVTTASREPKSEKPPVISTCMPVSDKVVSSPSVPQLTESVTLSNPREIMVRALSQAVQDATLAGDLAAARIALTALGQLLQDLGGSPAPVVALRDRA